MDINNVYCMDCLHGMQKLVKEGIKVDLIMTDPPYNIVNTKAGGKSELSRSIQNVNDEIFENGLTVGISEEHLELMWKLMKVPNIYIWCNGAQIPQYVKFFVENKKCKMDIIVWNKSNAMPLFNNKYLSDKEYCLYFRKGAYCSPKTYEKAKTVYVMPINLRDKKKYKHPTIKPLNIIKNMIENSSKEGELVLDPFIGSGTTAIACMELNRAFLGFEIKEEYYNVCVDRINEFLCKKGDKC